MNDDVVLLDSNILVYAFDNSEGVRHEKAKLLLEQFETRHFAVTLQNLAEFFTIVTTKITHPLQREDAMSVVNFFLDLDEFIKLRPSVGSLKKAMSLQVSFWDAMIAAVMLENKVFKIYTENVNDFKVEGLVAVNPFT